METTKTQTNKVAGRAEAPQGMGMNQRNRGARSRRDRDERPRSEFDQKTLQVRRVTRVTSGGKRFNISIVLAIGNHRGSVGIGTGKRKKEFAFDPRDQNHVYSP